MRRFLFSSMAAVVALTLVSTNARAGEIDLGTTGQFLSVYDGQPSNYFIVTTADGSMLKFSDFNYLPTNAAGGFAPPPATAVLVKGFTAGNEFGFTLGGSFNVPAGATYDYGLTYTVTALTGSISDATLIDSWSAKKGDGNVTVSETLVDGSSKATIGSLNLTGGTLSDTTSFAPVTSIIVSKDINVVGGSNGVTLSLVSQGFSTTAVPEPTSMALLGIGLSGLVTFRRFFKRNAVA